MLGFHQTKWIDGEMVVREVFESSDGRILGNECVYRQREVSRDGAMVKAVSGGPTGTEQFYSIAEAGTWLDELRCREQIVRVQLAGGTKLVLAALVAASPA